MALVITAVVLLLPIVPWLTVATRETDKAYGSKKEVSAELIDSVASNATPRRRRDIKAFPRVAD